MTSNSMMGHGLLLLVLSGCSDQNVRGGGNGNDGPKPGSILGRVCDPSGKTWLADAQAYTHVYDDAGRLVETIQAYSDPDGYWLLDDLTPADYEVYVQTGDEVVFQDVITVLDGEDVVLPEPSCFDPNDSKVAVITGNYDDFEAVLAQMGFANYTKVDGIATSSEDICDDCQYSIVEFLSNVDLMKQHDIILFNGGHLEKGIIYEEDAIARDEGRCVTPADTADTGFYFEDSDVQKNLENIREYVQGGGSIYASDWAYDVVEAAWPNRLDFVGNDCKPDDAQKGEAGLIQASISDAALASWLEKSSNPVTDVNFNLPVWPPMEAVDAGVSVHLSGSPSYRLGENVLVLTQVPLLASFNDGDGKVVYATFRVAENASADMLLTLQYMMYSL